MHNETASNSSTGGAGLTALVTVVVAVLIAAGVAWAGGQGGASIAPGVPVVVACAMVAFVVQWVAFVPAYLEQTEHFYDLTGSATYLGVTWFAVVASGALELRALLLAAMVSVWAARLGTFLFKRIRRDGKDGRFDDIKPSFGKFLVAWTLQGLWVFLTLCAALAAISAIDPPGFGLLDILGLLVWMAGFAIEVVADRQKKVFREANPGHFIDTGLWSWSRHPNYFGEITLWVGVAIMAASTLEGARWVTLISPFFVAFLLLRVSGIPMLEKRADERWGEDEAYQAYKARTSVLVPLPPR